MEKATYHHISSILGNRIAPSLVFFFSTVWSLPMMEGVLCSSQMILFSLCSQAPEKVTMFGHYIISGDKERRNHTG